MTQEDNNDVIREKLSKVFGADSIAPDDATINKAKVILGGQKLVAVPTSEPWADCGTLNQLYQTTMQIVSGAFPLEDFERARACSCVDTQSGLVTSSKEQLARIKDKYNIEGQVMVVPQAKKVTKESVSDVPVIVNERK